MINLVNTWLYKNFKGTVVIRANCHPCMNYGSSPFHVKQVYIMLQQNLN